MAALADMITEVFTMESAMLRADKIATEGGAAGLESQLRSSLARLYAAKAMDMVELAARKVVAAAAEGDALRTQMTILRRLAKHDPAGHRFAAAPGGAHMVKAGKYSL